MPIFDACHGALLRCLILLMAGVLVALPGWAGGVSTKGATPVPESTAGVDEAPKQAPPEKTKYDRLPLAQLAERAKANDANAQFELGSRFNYARGLPKNVKEALRWLRRAAENGQQGARRLLALKFYNGYEVPVDFDEAFKWTAQLADSGDVTAQLVLGNMYASGEGAPRNLVRAYMWYDIAATATPPEPVAGVPAEGASDAPQAKEGGTAEKEEAAERLKKITKQASKLRDEVVNLLLPEQEVEAQQLSSDWWLRQQGVSLEEKKPQSAVTSKNSKKQH